MDYLVLAIGGRDWKSIFDVRERMDQLLPPELLYRLYDTPGNRRRAAKGWATITGYKQSTTGYAIRRGMRAGLIERNVAINRGVTRNIGNHYLRLSPRGITRLKRIRFYLCNDCLHTGITRAISSRNAACGHCHGYNLQFYLPPFGTK